MVPVEELLPKRRSSLDHSTGTTSPPPIQTLNTLGENVPNRTAYTRGPSQSPPTSSLREIAGPSSSSLAQSPKISGLENRTPYRDNPSNEIISSEPILERTHNSVNVSQESGPHSRRPFSQVSPADSRKLSDSANLHIAKRQRQNQHGPGRRTSAPELLSDQEQPLDLSEVKSRSRRSATKTAPILPPSPRTPASLNSSSLESPIIDNKEYGDQVPKM